MGVPLLALLLALNAASYELIDASTVRECGYTVVLLGSTGDLAKRYIWPALFENSLSLDSIVANDCVSHELVVFGGSRSPIVDRDAILAKVLVNTKCNEGDDRCLHMLKMFQKFIRFVQVSKPEDYEKLALGIAVEYEARNLTELGRLVYLSIPPSAYVSTIEHVSNHLKPSRLTWLRVVLEKPFGRDLSSAINLNRALGELLLEEQVYRIDHYLGKYGVKLMSQFLEVNSNLLKPLWNNDGIQLIEVAMEETVDISGRGSFYDSNGVIRDVHQNHLMEILTILLDGSNVASKKNILAELFPPQLHHAVLGQYINYQKHLENDGILQRSMTPTYASVTLQSRDPNWKGVNFVLTSGKQLKQKRTFARVIFKHSRSTGWTGQTSCPHEIKFVIQQDGLKPGILLSDHFSKFELIFASQLTKRQYFEGNCSFYYYLLEADINRNSYIPLIKAVLEGKREYFVGLDSLLESWRIWTPLLEQIDHLQPQPLFYSPDNLHPLELKGYFSETSNVMTIDNFSQNNIQFVSNNTSSLTEHGLGVRILQATSYELTNLLAINLLKVALDSVNDHGSFHFALPGGTTPLSLFDALSLDYQHTFPWQHTHIWQTDERCVYFLNRNSNFKQIAKQLLSCVPISYLNVHPMPVHLQRGLCYHEDNGTEFYEKQLLEITSDGRLDYVLLGVGIDGHIASVFPGRSHNDNKLVDIIYSDVSHVSKRMTLTIECIIRAKNIGIVFIGEKKRKIVQTVKKCLTKEPLSSNACSELPVVKLIKAGNIKQFTLYIDSVLN